MKIQLYQNYEQQYNQLLKVKIYIPCSQIADEVGNPKVSNMVMLGAYVAGTKVLKPETIEKMIQEMFTGSKAKFVPLNIEAFHRGMACIE